MRYDYKRSDWLKGYRFDGPAFDWSKITQVVIHYTGSRESWVPPHDISSYILSSHRDWLRRKGYSLGYSVVVVDHESHPLNGTSWEVRSDEFRSAATAGVNDISFAILMSQRSNDYPSDKAIKKVRDLIAQAEKLAGRKLKIVGHNTSGGTTRTSCPGTGLAQALNDNIFSPTDPPKPPKPEPPKPPTPSGEDEMIAIYKPVFANKNDNTPWIAVFQSGVVRRAVNADVKLAQQTKVPIIDQDSEEQHNYLISIFPKR